MKRVWAANEAVPLCAGGLKPPCEFSIPVEPELAGVKALLPAILQRHNFARRQVGGGQLEDRETKVGRITGAQFAVAAMPSRCWKSA